MVRLLISKCTILIFFFGASLSNADKISVAVGVTIPPYVIHDEKTGMEYNIVSRALEICGHEISASFVPFQRMVGMIRTGAVQSAFPVSTTMQLDKVYFSEPHIQYRNVVITLEENNYSFLDVSALKGLNVAAFKGARKKLGPDYSNAVSTFSHYEEVYDQSEQINLLYFNRADAIVSDINFFDFHLKEIKKKGGIDVSKRIEVHELFPPSRYSVGFRKKAHRDAFNRALHHLKKSGEYNIIINKFVTE